MSKQKKIIYENEWFKGEHSTDRIEFRTPDREKFDERWAVRHRNNTSVSITDSEIIQSRVCQIGRTNYRVNACFNKNDARSAESAIKYLMELELQKCSEKVS